MIAELGQLCLCLAFLLACLQAATPLLHWWSRPHNLLPLVRPMATTYAMLLSGAFAALIYSYAISDFSVMNVVLNSHSAKPLLYKIVASWGNHEGSMILWAWILGAYGFVMAFVRTSERKLTQLALAVMGAVNAGLLSFILLTSNPFLRVWPTPAEGQDLNPLLQDIGLAFHPPTLYVGYVGFAAVFCYAVAGLLVRRIDRAWALAVHPFIMVPWSALTLGIGAGSWWAYRELGWGGWWFWDPVENVSLLPWLVGTALLHANMVLARRGQLAQWVVLLAILAFGMALIGTFIVRSGLITSVHAFASDPARGVFILAYIAITTGGALALYALRPLHNKAAPPAFASRTGLILLGNVLLVASAATVLLAILYPVFSQLLGAPEVAVGAPYFNRTFLPLAAPMLVLSALAPLLPWDRFTPAQLAQRLRLLGPALLVAVLLVGTLVDHEHILALGGTALCLWLLWGSAVAVRRAARARALLGSWPARRQLAGILAHVAVAIFAAGVTSTALFKQTYDAPLEEGRDLQFGDYTLHLKQATRTQEHNYTVRRATFAIRKNGVHVTELSPELRYYPVRDMQTTEAALYSTPMRDIYLAIGDIPTPKESKAPRLGVRMYVMPGQQWLWFAFILAAISGMVVALSAFFTRHPHGARA